MQFSSFFSSIGLFFMPLLTILWRNVADCCKFSDKYCLFGFSGDSYIQIQLLSFRDFPWTSFFPEEEHHKILELPSAQR